MNNEERVQYWVGISDYDMETADTMLRGGIAIMDKTEAMKMAMSKAMDYKALVNSHFPMKIEQFYLFGSYAKGTFREHSDIDIALVLHHFEGDFFETVPLLWKLTEGVDYRIEPHLIARDTDYADFLGEIRKTGVEII